MDWFRVDSGLPSHHKINRLARALKIQRTLAVGLVVSLWAYCSGSREDGDLTGMRQEDIAFSCGWEDEPEVLTSALVDVGFLDTDEDGNCTVHGWAARQPLLKRRVHDASTRRARRDHATSTPGARDEKPARARTDGRTDETDKNTLSATRTAGAAQDAPPEPRVTSDQIDAIARTWNETTTGPLPKVRLPITGPRAKLIRTRLAEPGFGDAWPEVCRRVNASTFCRGGSRGTGWVANLRDILRPGRWQEIIEGKYADAHTTTDAADIDQTIKRIRQSLEEPGISDYTRRIRQHMLEEQEAKRASTR